MSIILVLLLTIYLGFFIKTLFSVIQLFGLLFMLFCWFKMTKFSSF